MNEMYGAWVLISVLIVAIPISLSFTGPCGRAAFTRPEEYVRKGGELFEMQKYKMAADCFAAAAEFFTVSGRLQYSCSMGHFVLTMRKDVKCEYSVWKRRPRGGGQG